MAEQPLGDYYHAGGYQAPKLRTPMQLWYLCGHRLLFESNWKQLHAITALMYQIYGIFHFLDLLFNQGSKAISARTKLYFTIFTWVHCWLGMTKAFNSISAMNGLSFLRNASFILLLSLLSLTEFCDNGFGSDNNYYLPFFGWLNFVIVFIGLWPALLSPLYVDGSKTILYSHDFVFSGILINCIQFYPFFTYVFFATVNTNSNMVSHYETYGMNGNWIYTWIVVLGCVFHSMNVFVCTQFCNQRKTIPLSNSRMIDKISWCFYGAILAVAVCCHFGVYWFFANLCAMFLLFSVFSTMAFRSMWTR